MAEQIVYFGPPGSGKSHAANERAVELVGAAKKDTHIIRTVFHPETTYGDFVAKLLPSTDSDGKIRYDVHPGPFVLAVAKAIKNEGQHVVLIIDEINRGPAAGIFGDVFQLLDRDADGVSTYDIELLELVQAAFKLAGSTPRKGATNADSTMPAADSDFKLRLPANLSIFATMNTSDESVHYMDAAFKRRWEWNFIKWNQPSKQVESSQSQSGQDSSTGATTQEIEWTQWLGKLNGFIAKASEDDLWLKRSVDDKLVGLHWLRGNEGVISRFDIRNKLMHYLWDNVFARNRAPLNGLLATGNNGMLKPSGNNQSGESATKVIAICVDSTDDSGQNDTQKPQQTIFFGPPGSGKSHAANARAVALVGADNEKTHIFRTLFHPDTTYGDFVAKLMPMSDGDGKVAYQTHIGPMLKAVSLARNDGTKHVVLIIDEINRGHSAAVFGDFFQLLDRDSHGRSEYGIKLQKLVSDALLKKPEQDTLGGNGETGQQGNPESKFTLPENLSILATMNTSDESVFYMDTAFKRRWGWEFVPWNAGIDIPKTNALYHAPIQGYPDLEWGCFLDKLNRWIGEKSPMKGRDDKFVGLWVGKFPNPSTFKSVSTFLSTRRPSRGADLVTAARKAIDEVTKINPNIVKTELDALYRKLPEKEALNISGWTNWLTPTEASFPPMLDAAPNVKKPGVNTDEAFKRISAAFGEIFHVKPVAKTASFHPQKFEVSLRQVSCPKSALSHFLWDNVFQRDRNPISQLLNTHAGNAATGSPTVDDQTKGAKEAAEINIAIRTYGDFLDNWDLFVRSIVAQPESSSSGDLRTFGDFQSKSDAFIDAINTWKPSKG